MNTTLLRAGALSCALLASTALTAPARAQSQAAPPPVVSPISIEPDHNGVNLATGKITFEAPVLSVPAAPNLRYDRVQNAAPYITGKYNELETIANFRIHNGAGARRLSTANIRCARRARAPARC